MNTACIFDIQRYSIHDGPGIRTIVFFKGCQLACPWCSNPESLLRQPEIGYFKTRCKRCGKCQRVCGIGAIDVDRPYIINRETCNGCGECVLECSEEALRQFGSTYTVAHLLREVLKDRSYYRNSRGGVTVSGGEPTLQKEFLVEFLSECQASGLDTAMETNGHAPWETLEILANHVDHFLFDVKLVNSEEHRRTCGVPNVSILDNLTRLVARRAGSVSIRIPIIPQYNDDPAHIGEMVDMLRALSGRGPVESVHLIPYHAFGASKYGLLNMEYPLRDLASPSKEEMLQIAARIAAAGIPTFVGGG